MSNILEIYWEEPISYILMMFRPDLVSERKKSAFLCEKYNLDIQPSNTSVFL